MTHRPSIDPADRDPEPLLTPAESEAMGERIRALAGGLDAPPALRTWVRAAETARGPGRAPRPPRRPRLALAGAGGLVAAAAAALVLALVGGGGGGGGAPSVDAAAALALARPTAAAPATTGPADTQLAARVGEVTFPNYAYRWPEWKAAGIRHDTIGGRAATTVTYRGPAGDVGYTIVDGAPLPEPGAGRRIVAEGVPMRVFRKDGATVVTWRRDGHTCILAGRGAGAQERLVQFATWA
jgi:hypothetical protein